MINELITVQVDEGLDKTMFRNPDIPVSPKKKFSEANYKEEKEWLERKQQGLILSSETEGGIFLAIGTASLIGFVIGGVMGALIALFTGSFWHLITPFFIIFGISLYFLRGSFSTVDIDLERGLFLYEGTISLGGEFRSTRYRGPYQVIDATLLVRFKRFFFFKSQPFIRFMTNSGYLRLNFNPEKEEEFLRKWEELGLINIEAMKAALDKDPVRVEDDYIVYYQKKFDRSKFKAEMKQKREAEKQQEEIDKKIQRQKLIEKSKQYVKDEESESDKIQID